MIDPIEIDFTVACSPEHAFDVWTTRTTLRWPVEHTVSAEPDVAVSIEPRVGGRIFERTPAGTEHAWGEVLAWEPPHLLRYLWHIRRDRADATRWRSGSTVNATAPLRGSSAHPALEKGARDVGKRTGSSWGAPTSRRPRRTAPSRRGGGRRTTPSVAGTGSRRVCEAGSGCTSRRSSKSSGWRSWSTTRGTTGCAPSEPDSVPEVDLLEPGVPERLVHLSRVPDVVAEHALDHRAAGVHP